MISHFYTLWTGFRCLYHLLDSKFESNMFRVQTKKKKFVIWCHVVRQRDIFIYKYPLIPTSYYYFLYTRKRNRSSLISFTSCINREFTVKYMINNQRNPYWLEPFYVKPRSLLTTTLFTGVNLNFIPFLSDYKLTLLLEVLISTENIFHRELFLIWWLRGEKYTGLSIRRKFWVDSKTTLQKLVKDSIPRKRE